MQLNKCTKLFHGLLRINQSKRFLGSINIRERGKINNGQKYYVAMTTDSITNYSQFVATRKYCADQTFTIDSNTFETVCEETLDSLCAYFEELIEVSPHLQESDVEYSSGVLTVNFGELYGTYVINRQSPNRQIWFSSPTSGPKRYDYNPDKKCWVYKHDDCTLHQILQKEIKPIVKQDVDFSQCLYSLL